MLFPRHGPSVAMRFNRFLPAASVNQGYLYRLACPYYAIKTSSLSSIHIVCNVVSDISRLQISQAYKATRKVPRGISTLISAPSSLQPVLPSVSVPFSDSSPSCRLLPVGRLVSPCRHPSGSPCSRSRTRCCSSRRASMSA